MSSTIRVLVADDHPVVRSGLVHILEAHGFTVVGQAANGHDAVRGAQDLRPDVVLMDLHMEPMDGIAATREIQQSIPLARVLILSSYMEEDRIVEALRAGARGYVLKDASPEELVRAVQQAHEGYILLHPRAAPSLTGMAQPAAARPPSESPQRTRDALTRRENEILELLAQGLSNQDIAARLYIAEKTVKTHVSNILSKLQLRDRTQAAVYFLKHR